MPQEIFLICASAGNLSMSLKISVIFFDFFFRLTQFVGLINPQTDGHF